MIERRWRAARRAAVVLAALAAWAFSLAQKTRGASRAQAAREESLPAPPPPKIELSAAKVPLPAPEPEPSAEPLPPALRGTEVDGALEVDEQGNLILSAKTKLFFDYFLLASGEEDGPVVRRRVETDVRTRVREPAASQAMNAYDRYAGYRTHAIASAASDDQATQVRALRAARRQYFTDRDASAFFAREEALEDRVLARLADLARDAAAPLAPDPPDLRGSPADLARADLAWRKLPPVERQRARTEALGEEAAARLAALDEEDAAWNARFDAYRAARDALWHNERLDDAARTQQLEALRAQSFSPEERVRVEALDRMEASREREGRSLR